MDPIPACPACNCRDYQFRTRVEIYPLYRCRSCGTERLHPQPDDTAMAGIYTGGYQLCGGGNGSALEVMKRATARRFLRRLISAVPPPAVLLEVGPGWGFFLQEAEAAGYAVTGVELSTHSAEMAAKRITKGSVHTGTLEEQGFDEGSFDCCVMVDVIEHVRQPAAFLQTVARCMVPGGVMLMVTPDNGSLSARLMGNRWMEYKPEHLFTFSRQGLFRLVTSCGFEEPRFLRATKTLTLSYIAEYFQRFPVPIASQCLRWFAREFPDMFNRFKLVLPAGGMTVMAVKLP